jgi:mRNA-degrading endonuclease RelE of RelBE toxin-antitoxin system
MYQISLTKEAAGDLERLRKAGINLSPLGRYIKRLGKNPYIVSKEKSGNLAKLRAVEWGNGYRLVFEIFEDVDPKEVLIVSIDKHDDAYKKAGRRKKKKKK